MTLWPEYLMQRATLTSTALSDAESPASRRLVDAKKDCDKERPSCLVGIVVKVTSGNQGCHHSCAACKQLRCGCASAGFSCKLLMVIAYPLALPQCELGFRFNLHDFASSKCLYTSES